MTIARAQPRVRRSVRLTPRGRAFGILSGALFILSYSAGNPLLLLVACLLLGLVTLALVLARFRSMNLGIAREFSPSPVSATTPSQVSIDIANLAGLRSAPLYWNDNIPWRPFATEARYLAPLSSRNARGKLAVLSYELVPPRRGVFNIGPFAVAYSDPFGIAVGFMSIGTRDKLIVTPHVSDLPSTGLWLEAQDGAARLVQASGIGNSDDLMTREYRRGDALRRVHWRASARHGELMVRQEEQRTYPEATVVIDTRMSGHPDHGTQTRTTPPTPADSDSFEWAVTMIASLGVHLHRAGFVVHVTETAPAQIVELADDEARMGREDDFLVSLATVSLVDARSPLPAREIAEGPVFAVVSRPTDTTIEWLRTLRKPQELGVAFVVGTYPAVLDELTLAGWHTIAVAPHTDPILAWLLLAEELGLRVGD